MKQKISTLTCNIAKLKMQHFEVLWKVFPEAMFLQILSYLLSAIKHTFPFPIKQKYCSWQDMWLPHHLHTDFYFNVFCIFTANTNIMNRNTECNWENYLQSTIKPTFSFPIKNITTSKIARHVTT